MGGLSKLLSLKRPKPLKARLESSSSNTPSVLHGGVALLALILPGIGFCAADLGGPENISFGGRSFSKGLEYRGASCKHCNTAPADYNRDMLRRTPHVLNLIFHSIHHISPILDAASELHLP